jgi:hypothetical protein
MDGREAAGELMWKSPAAGVPAASDETYPAAKPPLIRLLRAFTTLIPSDHLQTAFYLNCVDRPRRFLRSALFAFYRFDHVYAVLREFSRTYRGKFSVIEFGTSDGYAFVKLLYATRYLRLEDRVVVHGFDNFEGLPPPTDARDEDWISRDGWVAGQFKGRYEALDAFCSKRYSNYRLHKGQFDQSIDAAFVASLAEWLPILVWVDADYYSSARTVVERLIDHLPNGCVIYFDELEGFNFGSRLTGEACIVHEVNSGHFGDNVELVPDMQLSLQSRRLYRFVRLPPNRTFERVVPDNMAHHVRRHSGGSPLP